MRIGTFELLETDTPPHASVNAAVDGAGRLGGPKLKGFVNGLLRSIERYGDPQAGDRIERFGIDGEILADLDRAWGAEVADSFLESSFEPAPTVGRYRRGAPASKTGIEPFSDVDGAYVVSSEMDTADWAIQDAASVVVGSVVPLGGSGPILDMAAAPGGKALHLFDRLGASDRLVLADAHPKRLARSRQRMQTMGPRCPVGVGRRPGGTFRIRYL